jgi:hypothetical protein
VTEERWRPLSGRNAGPDPELDGPFEGVPVWLGAELWEWAERALLGAPSPNPTLGVIRETEWLPRLRGLAHELHIPLETISDGPVRYDVPLGRLHALVSKDDGLFLDVVDYLLRSNTSIDRRGLEALLASAGSAWTVNARGKGLERRVDSTATLQVSMAIDAGGRPAAHLAIAWAEAFGRNPDPAKAYAEAVKAVEAAVIPVVIPNDKIPTLGKAIGQLRDQPGQFHVAVGPSMPASRVSLVAQMLDLIWVGQHDRHGHADPLEPMAVSQREAEAALYLAVTLVQWFKSGVVTRA